MYVLTFGATSLNLFLKGCTIKQMFAKKLKLMFLTTNYSEVHQMSPLSESLYALAMK
jgi:hypothetical protein